MAAEPLQINTTLPEREAIFDLAFRGHMWGGQSVSGPGSDLPATESLRPRLAFLFRQLGITSLCDVPCGDFHWLKEVDLEGIRYIGCDIVSSLIAQNVERYGSEDRSFQQLDIVNEVPPKADLVLCKDILLHLTNAEITDMLRNIRKSGAQYVLINGQMTPTFAADQGVSNVNINGTNADTPKSDFGTEAKARLHGRNINLMLPPFSLPEPQLMVMWNQTGAHFGLWKAEDLPA